MNVAQVYIQILETQFNLIYNERYKGFYTSLTAVNVALSLNIKTMDKIVV